MSTIADFDAATIRNRKFQAMEWAVKLGVAGEMAYDTKDRAQALFSLFSEWLDEPAPPEWP